MSKIISTIPGRLAANQTDTWSTGSGGRRRASILDRSLNRAQASEVNLSAFSFLFSEILQYTQNRVDGISDFEQRLNTLGFGIGVRVLELTMWREKGQPRRERRVLNVLYYIHSVVWKSLFGRPAHALEKSTDNEDEYMLIDNEPVASRFVSVPKELSQFNCNAFVAGIIEGVLHGCQCSARVTAHTVPVDGKPLRTIFLIKLSEEAVQREEQISK
ncbi:protein particle complex subunit [Tieghemiomyces parasiticus]|uniref:Trafficking protein particle complex subunit n=1 Tax=Tieghemiomyces parasiticus TaxID=78921 RepID=A0A9W7ZQJ3_9FUNG|nr:protein particle complex subunit [Tieghemiomyces parasiticus]